VVQAARPPTLSARTTRVGALDGAYTPRRARITSPACTEAAMERGDTPRASSSARVRQRVERTENAVRASMPERWRKAAVGRPPLSRTEDNDVSENPVTECCSQLMLNRLR